MQELLIFNGFRNIKQLVFSLYLSVGAACSVQCQYNGFHIVNDVWIEKRVLQELLQFNEFRNIKHLVFSLYLSIGAAWSAQWQYNGFHIVIGVCIEKTFFAIATLMWWIQKYQASCILTLPKYRCRSYTYFLCLIVK